MGFFSEHLDNEGRTTERRTMVADGAFISDKLSKKANIKNIGLVTTDISGGREINDIYADFAFTKDRCSDDGIMLTTCLLEVNSV